MANGSNGSQNGGGSTGGFGGGLSDTGATDLGNVNVGAAFDRDLTGAAPNLDASGSSGWDFNRTGATIGSLLGGILGFGPGGMLIGRELGGYAPAAVNAMFGGGTPGPQAVGAFGPGRGAGMAPGAAMAYGGGAGVNAAAPAAAYGGGGLNLGPGGGMPGVSAGPGGFGTLGGGGALGAGNLGGFGAPGGMGTGAPGGMGTPNVASLLQSLDPRTLQALAQYFAQMRLLGMGGNVFDPLSGTSGGTQGAMPVGLTGYGQAAYGRTV